MGNSLEYLVRLLCPNHLSDVFDTAHVLSVFTDFKHFLQRRKALTKDYEKTWSVILMLCDWRMNRSRWAIYCSRLVHRYQTWPPPQKEYNKIKNSLQKIIVFLEKTEELLDSMIIAADDLQRNNKNKMNGLEFIGNTNFVMLCDQILWGLDYEKYTSELRMDITKIVISCIPIPQDTFIIGGRPDNIDIKLTEQAALLPAKPVINSQYVNSEPRKDIHNKWNPNLGQFEHETQRIVQEVQAPNTIIIIEADTGTGKSLCIPALLSARGIVIVAVHHRLHGRRLSKTLNNMLNTSETVFIDNAHMIASDDSENKRILAGDPKWTGYVPLEEAYSDKKVIVVMTYKTAAKYLHRGQYPSFIVLDDIYVDSEERNFFLMCLKDKMTSLARHTKIIGTNAAVPGYPRNLLRRIPGTNFTVRSMSNLQGPGNIIDMDHLSRGVYASLCEVFHTHLSQAEITDFEQTARGRELLDVFQNPKNQQVVNDIYNTVERGEITYAQVLEYWIDNYQTLYRPDDFYELIAEVKRMRRQILPEPAADVINLYLRTCFSNPLSHPGVMLVFVRDAVKVRELCAAVNNTFAQQEIEVIPVTESGESEAIYKAGLDLLKSTRSEYRPRVVISDSIAESSVTIPNVTFVIDTNETSSEITDLTGTRVRFSKTLDDQARKQRRGRTGRTNSGFYYNLRLNDAPSQQPIVDSLPFGDMKKTLLEYIDFLRGTRILKTELLTRLEARFPTGGNMENAVAGHIWEYIYSQLLNEGSLIDVKKNDGLEVYITHLGRLILNFPGNYKESRLVAIGAFCGVFRNIIAYVVISRDLDSLENQPILARWFDSFNNSANDRMFDESYIQKIIDMAYILGREANEQVMALKMGIDPHMVYRWRRAMRSFEEVMYLSISIPGDQRFFSSDFDPNANLSSIVTTWFALMAGSGEDILLSDNTRGLRATLYNRIIEDETSESSETDVQYLSTFCRLHDNPHGSTEVLGTTTIPAVIACLAYQVFTTKDNECLAFKKEDTMYINLIGFSNGKEILSIYYTRQHIRRLFCSVINGGTNKTLMEVMQSIGDYYYKENCAEYTRMSSVGLTPYATAKQVKRAKLSIPPYGTNNRYYWCKKCIFPGHTHPHCITVETERRKRCFIALNVFEKFSNPSIRKFSEIQQNVNWVKEGRFYLSSYCSHCLNMFHIMAECPIQDTTYCHEERNCILYLLNTGIIKDIANWSGPGTKVRNRFLDEPHMDFDV